MIVPIVGRLIKEERERQGLTQEQTARLAGYRQIAKGIRRIANLESGAMENESFARRIATALNVDADDLWQQALAESRQKAEADLARWLLAHPHSPLPSHLIVRIFSAAQGRHEIPADLTTIREIIHWAKELAAKHQHEVCLPLSPSTQVWIDRHGYVVGFSGEEDGR
jgi:transcriptional regulator with XRE-family HTH domain